ncbi:MAG: asparagine synthase (glutamine-hydrolyzing) [Bacteroidia bacterium]
MCGIAGFIDHKPDASEREFLLGSMLQAIAHRGPDARGTWFKNELALGQNRLSIIDLSKDGNQPMFRGDIVIVYNGEVYNYREIRKELEAGGAQFHTQSDTEVILAAYEAWGTSCVDRFTGMWAFAIWDEKQKQLFCSRDRFGIKPFFYIEEGGRFYFGSEYKALFPSPLFRKELNHRQVYRGLQLGWNAYHDETYFSCIKALPAAHNLLIRNNGEVFIERYWDIETGKQETFSPADAAMRFRELFEESISLHMRSDVEVGGCLSGGLDSSAIASVVGRDYAKAGFKTFTVYYEGQNEVDERPWVKEVLKKYDHLEPYYFTPTDDDIRESFAHAIYHADVPLAGSSPISQYFVMKLAASKGIKVLLDGQGSDEMLGGYMHSFYRLIGGAFRKGKLAKMLKESATHAGMQNFSSAKRIDVLLKSMLAGVKTEQQLYELEYRKYLPFLATEQGIPFDLPDKEGTRLNQFLYHLTFTTSLPTLLQFEDRNSMAFSIESRVPFLTHHIAEFAFSLADQHKISGGVTKQILREGMKGIMPDAIIHRKDKKGFVTPGEVKWLRGPLKHLLDQNFSDIGFVDHHKVNKLIDEFKAGNNQHANLIWRIAVLRWWMG